MKYVPFCMIVIQTLVVLVLVLVSISRPDNMQLHELILTQILMDLVMVYDAILTSRQTRDYSVCMRIQCRLISVKRLFWKKYEL